VSARHGTTRAGQEGDREPVSEGEAARCLVKMNDAGFLTFHAHPLGMTLWMNYRDVICREGKRRGRRRGSRDGLRTVLGPLLDGDAGDVDLMVRGKPEVAGDVLPGSALGLAGDDEGTKVVAQELLGETESRCGHVPTLCRLSQRSKGLSHGVFPRVVNRLGKAYDPQHGTTTARCTRRRNGRSRIGR
jgi:hypothetical protein